MTIIVDRHSEYKVVPRKYNSNGMEKTLHYYTNDTEHICVGQDNKLSKFSMVLYKGICPHCHLLVVELEVI